MQCSECRSESVPFQVPDAVASYAPGGSEAVAICTSCLHLQPVESAPASADFSQVSEAFPADEVAAVEMALIVGLLSSLALNRGKIEELLERVEGQGVDPMLVLEELETDSHLQPSVAIGRRRQQLEQLLE
ncbi:DUF6276 family protein [Haloarchaeobius sp. HME9146]|uniref:DUF6276 family protein n=1 Tax=Haloarchaeobius sp. HME9146 TaxID=2978732 RepID=UPI0021C24132|nr:DUF6276 family protein [Haloarchaeobius sp. HME9146]MCT9094610.1 DUF6276 family protein [Haloarchaeobius sp. HME9146]